MLRCTVTERNEVLSLAQQNPHGSAIAAVANAVSREQGKELCTFLNQSRLLIFKTKKMKRLERSEMKNLLGGIGIVSIDDPSEGAETCCTQLSDCPEKEKKTANCKPAYSCSSDATKNRCIYTSIG